jgi:hypothetical protein
VLRRRDADESQQKEVKEVKEVKNRKKKQSPPNPPGGGNGISIVLPEWIDPENWAAFLQFRTEIKKPVSNTAAKRIFNQLEKWKIQGMCPNEVLNRSIMNRWQGIFPLQKGTYSEDVLGGWGL